MHNRLRGAALGLRLKALGLGLALTLWAISPLVRAQTLLDDGLSDPSSVTSEFFKLGPHDSTFDNFPAGFTFQNGDSVWSASAGGSFVAGQLGLSSGCPQGQTNSTCTEAAVWTPNFGSGGSQATAMFLPLPTVSIPIGDTLTSLNSNARGIDAAGETIAGYDYAFTLNSGTFLTTPFYGALIWSRNANQSWATATVTTLTTAFENAVGARGINDEGTYAVGWSGSTTTGSPFNVTDGQATLWHRTALNTWGGGQLLGFLSGDDVSDANDVALDGTQPVVVGWSGMSSSSFSGTTPFTALERSSDFGPQSFELFNNVVTQQPFVWDGTMHALPTFSPGGNGDATAISSDASTIVGWSGDSSFVVPGAGSPLEFEAVRWTRPGTGWSGSIANPRGLGAFILPGGNPADPNSYPLGSVALGVSEKGDAVVGTVIYPFPSEATPQIYRAFVWTKDFGNGPARYLGDVLAQAGVKVPAGWTFQSANDVRSLPDSFVIVGYGQTTGVDPAFIVRLGPQTGVTTPSQQIQSFNQISSAALAVGTNIGATLTGLDEMAENHRCIRPQDKPTGKWCVFGFGTGGLFDSGDIVDGGQFSGDVGIAHYLTPVTSVGVEVGSGLVNTDLQYGGSYRENEVHVGGYAAHIPDTGWRLFGAGLWGNLSDIDITRGYLNGLGYSDSFGSTNGDGWGLLGRVGFGFRTSAHSFLTPFTQVTYTDAHLNGYRESGGPFPATFQDVDTNTTVGRAGVLEETDLSPNIRVFSSAAWAQVLDSETPFVKGAVLDIFELSTNGSGNESGWAEFMAGGRYQLSHNGVLSVSASADTQFNDFFSLNGHIGYSQIF